MLNRLSRLANSGEAANTPQPETQPAPTAPAPTTTALPAPAAMYIPEGFKSFNQTQAGQDRQLPRFKLGDLEGETIIIHGVEPFSGKFGSGLRVVITLEGTGERGVLLGHWTVLGKYLEAMQAANDLPVYCKVVKAQGKRYFDFADPLQPQVSLDDPAAEIPF